MSKTCSEYICSNDKDQKMIQEALAQGRRPPRDTQMPEGPLNAIWLGRVSWGVLHKMALRYPASPSQEDKDKMKRLINAFSFVYAC